MIDDDNRQAEETMPGDDLLDEPEEAREWFRRKARAEGLKATFDAMIDILRDPRSPAPARATMAGLMLRSSGMFSKRFEEDSDSDGKPLDQLTGAEMQKEVERALRGLKGRRRALQRDSGKAPGSSADRKGAGGVFE